MPTAKEVVRIAAISDIHCTTTSQGELQPLFAQANEGRCVVALRRLGVAVFR